MKTPFSWLKEFLPSGLTHDEVERRLTSIGLEVESREEKAGDVVFEVNVTPNRGDCLSIIGIARELAASLGRPLRSLAEESSKFLKAKPSFSVTVQDKKACLQYSLAILEGVQIRPSSDLIIKRLEQCGIRSINNVVDVTNYVLLELGQPLHAFDRDKLHGNRLMVRRAIKGEKLTTLDDIVRELTPEDLVIADDSGPVALAGIMGGKGSEVTESTTAIALECAWFDPATVRRTARRLGIQTESSFRFERNVDFQGVSVALQRAIALIQKAAGGQLTSLANVKPSKTYQRKKISWSPKEVSSLLGGEWKPSELAKILKNLSCDVRVKGKQWNVFPPSYRSDLKRPIDLVEEVARLRGFEKIPERFPVLSRRPLNPLTERNRFQRLKNLVVDLGFSELIHLSFLSPEDLQGFEEWPESKRVAVKNPLGQEYSVMRPSLIPSLLKTTAFHQRHRILTFRGFELQKCFEKTDEGIREGRKLGLVLTGSRLFSSLDNRKGEADFYDLKGVAERILAEFRVSNTSFEPGKVSYFHPSKQAVIRCPQGALGMLGEVHPDVHQRFGFTASVCALELDADLLEKISVGADPFFKDYPRTPLVTRDLALILSEEIPAGAVKDVIQMADSQVTEVTVFDLYRGNQIPGGKKSVAFSIQMAHPDRTLTDEEVNVIHQKIVEKLKARFGAEVR